MRICKIFKWCYGHKLNLDYDSPCQNQHGHNSLIEFEFEGPLNKNGMVIDFKILKERINKISFDHKNLNDIMSVNPTAENIILMLKEAIDNMPTFGEVKLRRIRVWETDTSYAEEVWE